MVTKGKYRIRRNCCIRGMHPDHTAPLRITPASDFPHFLHPSCLGVVTFIIIKLAWHREKVLFILNWWKYEANSHRFSDSSKQTLEYFRLWSSLIPNFFVLSFPADKNRDFPASTVVLVQSTSYKFETSPKDIPNTHQISSIPYKVCILLAFNVHLICPLKFVRSSPSDRFTTRTGV